MQEQNSFKKGIADGMPICFGYLSVSFAFGIFVMNQGVFKWFHAVIMSLTNLTSAGQLAAVPIIALGGSLLELATAQFIINLRYALMSVSLSQKLSGSVRFIERFIISFAVTDEIYAVAVSNKLPVGTRYMLGLATMPILGWTSGTFLGAVAGNFLPQSIVVSLGVAIYGMFVAIVLPVAKAHKQTLYCVILAISLSLIFNFTPFLKGIGDGFIIIICAVLASAVFAILRPIEIKENEDE